VSAEIVAADRIEVVFSAWLNRRHDPQSGLLRHQGRVGESSEHRERKTFVPGLDRLVQPLGHLPVRRQGATPFALADDGAHEFPLGQPDLDQRERDIGPRFGLDQASQPASLRGVIPFPYQIDFAMYGNDVMDLTSAGLRSM
jgi:hypothetical protein